RPRDGTHSPSPSPGRARWRPSSRKVRPTAEAVWGIPLQVRPGEARTQPERRGEPMPHVRSAADQSTPAIPRVGATGLEIERYFTEAGAHPFDLVEWEIRDAEVGKFKQEGVEFPASWSQNAPNHVAQK